MLSVGQSSDWPAEEEEVACGSGDIIMEHGLCGPSLELSEDFKNRLAEKWELAVVVKVLWRNSWVQFPELCPSRYHTHILRALANMVGRTNKFDENTRVGDRGKFARIAVEVDLEKPLRGLLMVEGKERKVVYEGLPPICYHCGRVTHALFSCPFKENQDKRTPVPEAQPILESQGTHTVEADNASGTKLRQEFGEWMNTPACKPKSAPKKSTRTNPVGPKAASSLIPPDNTSNGPPHPPVPQFKHKPLDINLVVDLGPVPNITKPTPSQGFSMKKATYHPTLASSRAAEPCSPTASSEAIDTEEGGEFEGPDDKVLEDAATTSPVNGPPLSA
ncbi:hypothetical protein Tsubulata_022767 [Turnera subulata]|uniref:CCHC-type domain-containing protein n=1 Tax=Turnera subulata TaxID=218843 RepID=A0A9Q0GB86_9ROSI|nr:hypothetical protein Tsubulata_022767 [Turnera subulata]